MPVTVCQKIQKFTGFTRRQSTARQSGALREGAKNVAPVLRLLEEQASAPLARGAYTPVCEHDKGTGT